jgi:hypothetical protein
LSGNIEEDPPERSSLGVVGTQEDARYLDRH